MLAIEKINSKLIVTDYSDGKVYVEAKNAFTVNHTMENLLHIRDILLKFPYLVFINKSNDNILFDVIPQDMPYTSGLIHILSSDYTEVEKTLNNLTSYYLVADVFVIKNSLYNIMLYDVNVLPVGTIINTHLRNKAIDTILQTI